MVGLTDLCLVHGADDGLSVSSIGIVRLWLNLCPRPDDAVLSEGQGPPQGQGPPFKG